jgi:hypothetical protein
VIDTTDSIRRALASGGAALQQYKAQYERIRNMAEARQKIVQQEINALSPKVLIDRDAAKRYQNLTLENAQLSRVLIPYEYPA